MNLLLFTNLATSANGFAVQLAEVLTSELDKVAPLKTITRMSTGKRINRFLSDEAVKAKQERRRLERCWKRSGKETDRQRYCKSGKETDRQRYCTSCKDGKETDRQRYRTSCKETNRLINNSRRHYYADHINIMSEDARKRWATVKELLHTSDKDNTQIEVENRTACTSMTDFFR